MNISALNPIRTASYTRLSLSNRGNLHGFSIFGPRKECLVYPNIPYILGLGTYHEYLGIESNPNRA